MNGTVEYAAANGHKMVAETRWNGQEYVPIQWSAQHSDNCSCVNSEDGDGWVSSEWNW